MPARKSKPEAHPVTLPRGFRPADVEQHTLETRDGVTLYYETVGDGDTTFALANGLGGRLYAWGPILRAFRDRYRLVTWDYRGLYESGAPERIRRLSIQEHAEDLAEILDAINADSALVAGWSMGVQVGLEFATLFPERAKGLVLLNGTYGSAFSSALQPLIRIPGMPDLLHRLAEWYSAKTDWIERAGNWIQENLDRVVSWQIAMSPVAPNRDEMNQAMRQYLTDIFATEFRNYLRLFQELDAHSVYHLLPNIDIPALIISGGLDVLTPPRQSRQMAKRMPRARHRHLRLANHYALLEYPDTVTREIERFLADVRAGRL